MSPRWSFIVCAFLASATAFAQSPVPPSDTVSLVKALAHSASDLEKFVGMNPKAQISQAQVSYQDDGYQVTITSQVCDPLPAPQPVALTPITVPDGASNPLPSSFTNPFDSLPPLSSLPSLPTCKTYGMLVIQATADGEAQDGYTYQTLYNATLRRK